MTKQFNDVPKTLEKSHFFGYNLNEEQLKFRDEIWNPDKLIVFSDSKAGTGKSFVAVATSVMLVKYGLYDGITYIVSPTQELKQGYLPGTLEEKTQFYFQPLYQALEKIDENPMTAIAQNNIMNKKNGLAYIDAVPHTFLRGSTFENRIVILDETQNFKTDELKKTLTRISDNCKTIVIGHSGQNDLGQENPKSGFAKYIKHFEGKDYCSICNLTINYRGEISSWADEMEEDG